MKAALELLLAIFLTLCIVTPGLGYTITISTGDYPPWSGQDIPHKGFNLHVIREAFKCVGIEVKYEFYPWIRAYSYIKHGTVDASAFWFKSEKREADCLYSDPLHEEVLVFFYRKAKPLGEWNTLKDLKRYKIGLTRGYTYSDKVWDLAREGELDVSIADSDLINFRMLLRGRIDLFPGTLVNSDHVLNAHFAPEVVQTLEHSKKPFRISTSHLLFPKGRASALQLLQKFNTGLAQLKASGKYNAYYKALLAGKYFKRRKPVIP